jgi:hypothetical protein
MSVRSELSANGQVLRPSRGVSALKGHNNCLGVTLTTAVDTGLVQLVRTPIWKRLLADFE